MNAANTPDPTKSKLDLNESEAVDWVSYGSSGRRIKMTVADLQALVATSDPALQGLVERAKEALNVTDFQRDAYTLALRRASEGEMEIDADATISEGEDNGAYVSTWTWIDFASTPLDINRDADDANEEPREQSR